MRGNRNNGRGGKRGGGRKQGGRGRNSGNRRRHHSNGRNNRRDPRAASRSGNRRERISVESGHMVLIDQFMLANQQFIDRIVDLMDEDPSAKDEVVANYGGTVVELQPGTYRIDRDPFAYTIIVHNDGDDVDTSSMIEQAEEAKGRVFIDTRCLAMIDRELLDDKALLQKYKELWFEGNEKACRDLLRDNGGAVRYGFRRYGDELGVYTVKDEEVVCLWPDVNEPEGEGEGEAAEQ